MIRADKLTKNYGFHRAVDSVSFEVEQGDIVGLLGPNGSGKTTVMRMLTGFFAPTSGSCQIAGVDVQEDPLEVRRRIGYLPERVALYPDISVRRYLAFVARIHGVRGFGAVRSQVGEAMEQCGLTHVASKFIGHLSRGYRQRVGIAQAVIHRPSVLILDEPTVGLDPRQIVEIRELIRELAGETTVLLSTHILPEVSVTCRRVLILDHGKLIAEDTADGLMKKTVGQDEIAVRIIAPSDEVQRHLGQLPGVHAVRIDRVSDDGVVDVTARLAPDGEESPDIAAALVKDDWRIVSIAPKVMSLEDLFVRILDRAAEEKGK